MRRLAKEESPATVLFLKKNAPSQHLFLWQTYIKSMDKDFVAATIQAIGRCATNIGEVRDTCLNGLVQLLSNRDGESVYVSLHPLPPRRIIQKDFSQLRNSWRRSRLCNPGLLQRFNYRKFLSFSQLRVHLESISSVFQR